MPTGKIFVVDYEILLCLKENEVIITPNVDEMLKKGEKILVVQQKNIKKTTGYSRAENT